MASRSDDRDSRRSQRHGREAIFPSIENNRLSRVNKGGQGSSNLGTSGAIPDMAVNACQGKFGSLMFFATVAPNLDHYYVN